MLHSYLNYKDGFEMCVSIYKCENITKFSIFLCGSNKYIFITIIPAPYSQVLRWSCVKILIGELIWSQFDWISELNRLPESDWKLNWIIELNQMPLNRFNNLEATFFFFVWIVQKIKHFLQVISIVKSDQSWITHLYSKLLCLKLSQKHIF